MLYLERPMKRGKIRSKELTREKHSEMKSLNVSFTDTSKRIFKN